MINPGEILLTVQNVNKKFVDKDILINANFGINSGDKIGIIGVNGCGKSTFLKILTSSESQDSGEITYRKDINIAYLKQIPIQNKNATIVEQIFSSDKEEFQLIREYNGICDRLAIEQNDDLYKQQTELAERIDAIDGWKIEAKAKNYLSRLNIKDINQKIGNLSGGQKRKVDLATVLLQEPDLLILDEPTNHLDIDSIEWMQSYFTDYLGTIIFVTHDRYFLDSICNKIMEIDKGVVRFYEGNYTYYLEKKEQERIDLERKETRRKAQLSREIEWLQRGARARSSKPRYHIELVHKLMNSSYSITESNMQMSFSSSRMGKKILELKDISMNFGKKDLIKNFNYFFQKGDRIGIIGDNGCGKTTLLKIIMQELSPTTGTLDLGINTKFAYISQNIDSMPEDKSVYDYITSFADNIKAGNGVVYSASQMLERFLFDSKMQQAKICSLSGGEKKRLHLLKNLMFGANFIILDEPTNDLDIKTLEVLEEYLDNFSGCILLVSHDRYLLDRLCEHLFVFEKQGIRKFAGTYSDYLLVKRFLAEEDQEDKKDKVTKQKTEKKGLTYKEKKRLEEIKRLLQEKELRVEELNNKIANEAAHLTATEFSNISKEQESLDEELLDLLEEEEILENKIR